MSIAVASTTTASTNNASSLVINKPSSVAIGDVLVIAACCYVSTETPSISGFTKAAEVMRNSGSAVIGISLSWRIATASDVSASNYTITVSSGQILGIATMFRITGWTPDFNPIFTLNTSSQNSTGVVTTVGNTFTAARPSASSLLIIASALGSATDRNPTWAGYSVTSGVSNPSWIELQDIEALVESNNRYIAQAVAYATTTNNTDITQWAATIDHNNDNTAAVGSIFIVIQQSQNVTPSVSLNVITPEMFGLVATNPVVIDVGHTNITPVISGVMTNVNNQIWTPEVKTSAAWTPEIK